jgi:predicted MFS family arabinose efflux permease
VAAALAAARALPESRAPEARALDLSGAALVTLGLFLLIYPLTEGRERGWPSWVLAMVVGSAVLLAAFAALQARKTRLGTSPLVYITLFRDAAFRRGIVLAALLMTGIPSFFFVLTLYLQIGFGFSALHAGLTTFPFAVGSAGASLASDRLVRRFGLVWLQAGCLVLTAAMVILTLAVGALGAGMTSWHLVAILLAAGLGLGAVLAPMTNVILAGIQSREVGSASGVLSTGQQIGGALGVALIGIVFFAALPAATAAGQLGVQARKLAFAAALRDTLVYPIAVFGACSVLFFALRRAHGARRTD